jgi:hypothetical protein
MQEAVDSGQGFFYNDIGGSFLVIGYPAEKYAGVQ